MFSNQLYYTCEMACYLVVSLRRCDVPQPSDCMLINDSKENVCKIFVLYTMWLLVCLYKKIMIIKCYRHNLDVRLTQQMHVIDLVLAYALPEQKLNFMIVKMCVRDQKRFLSCHVSTSLCAELHHAWLNWLDGVFNYSSDRFDIAEQ